MKNIVSAMADSQTIELLPALQRPGIHASWRLAKSDGKIEINVLFTTCGGTAAALKVANQWTRSLDARITLWHMQIVPRPLPITESPVCPGFIESKLQSLLEMCGTDIEAEIKV